MQTKGIVYIVVGVIALLGALAAAYVNLTIGEALAAIGNSSPELAGGDTAALQESARALGSIVTIAWVWIIAVLASGAITVRAGLDIAKAKK